MTSGDAKDPLDRLEHRMDVTMTAGSKKAAMRVCGISGKSIVENAAATHGSPECNPRRSERAHAFRECGGVSQIERTILFRPSFRVTPVSFSGRHFSQHPSSSSYNLSFRPHCFRGCLFTLLSSPILRHKTSPRGDVDSPLLSFSQQKSLSVSEVASDSPSPLSIVLSRSRLRKFG